jgi:tetratricopeptide (TPR) repeat protein
MTPWLLAGVLLIGGCATAPQTQQLRDSPPAGIDRAVELSDVPFYPQQRYQCGPAALATVLQWSGVEVDPDALVPQVYVPVRRGSFQPEMLAAARRHGRVPYVLAPELSAIIEELQAGHPVLVLQNLAYNWAPRWHYAVVVGFDHAREELILRSGTIERHRMPFALFERTWRRGDHWAVVVTAPEETPASADELRWLEAVLDLERTGQADPAGRAWQAATRRWPDSAGAWIGLGNHRFRHGEHEAAVQAYRGLLALRPGYPPALNNLAFALARMGRLEEAEAYAEQALAADPGDARYRDTLDGIRRELGQ